MCSTNNLLWHLYILTAFKGKILKKIIKIQLGCHCGINIKIRYALIIKGKLLILKILAYIPWVVYVNVIWKFSTTKISFLNTGLILQHFLWCHSKVFCNWKIHLWQYFEYYISNTLQYEKILWTVCSQWALNRFFK